MDDYEKKTLAGVLTKYARFYTARERDLELQKEVEARLEAHRADLKNYGAAFALFGCDYTSDGLSKIKEILGQKLYSAALEEAKKNPQRHENNEDDDVSGPKENTKKEDDASTFQTKGEKPNIREIVLSHLKAAGEKGDGATAIRKMINALYGVELHEKTVGMTLYRLSKDYLVRREGRTWFFVPPQAETKNPGGDTPGPNVLD